MTDYISELYQGEVLGEALFNRMLGDLVDQRERHVIATMLQLETETKARLRQAAAERDLPLAELDTQRVAGERVGASLASFTWLDKMRRLEAGIGRTYLPRYHQIAALAATGDKDVADHMVVHETALLNLVHGELSGDNDRSLAAVQALLLFPLRQPPAASTRR